jgi:hypothetical protein
MRWFRDNIRHGSWLTLLALVVNLGLSFGHIHFIEGHRAALGQSPLVTAVASPDGSQQPGHSDEGQPDYLCPVCMAAAALGTALGSTQPALPVQFAAAILDRSIDPSAALPERPRAAFQSRAPPLS